MKKRVVEFYTNGGKNHRGLTLEDIWAFDDHAMEWTHDYIQWLFPMETRSRNSLFAPKLDEETVLFLRENAEFKVNQQKSFQKMLGFFGLEQQGEEIVVADEAKIQKWVRHNNHNYKRVTRMLHSMKILGLQEEAERFRNVLKKLYEQHASAIGEKTYQYWMGA